MLRSVSQARGHPDVCHDTMRFRSLLPQCPEHQDERYQKTSQRTREEGRQVHFHITRPHNVVGLATCSRIVLCFIVFSLRCRCPAAVETK